MKAFDISNRKLTVHEKKLRGLFSEAVEASFFTEEFCNAEMFFEFRRELMITMVVAGLFKDGDIDFVHFDNQYENHEFVETSEGTCLCISKNCSYKELMEIVEESKELLDETAKKKKSKSTKPPVTDGNE